jgi:hypothetical protein
VAIGTSDGAVTVLQLSAGLSEMAPNEKSAINNMLDRETQREKVREGIEPEAEALSLKVLTFSFG